MSLDRAAQILAETLKEALKVALETPRADRIAAIAVIRERLFLDLCGAGLSEAAARRSANGLHVEVADDLH